MVKHIVPVGSSPSLDLEGSLLKAFPLALSGEQAGKTVRRLVMWQ